MATQSKRFHITLSEAEGLEIEQIAAARKVPPTQVIRERLDEWQRFQSNPPSTVQPLVPQPEVDPRLDVIVNLLQPLERRLQRLDEHGLTVQEISSTLLSESREHDFGVKSLLQQILREDIPTQSVDVVERSLFLQRMERLELYAEALYKHIEQIGLDVAPPEADQQANNEHIRAQLDNYLAAKQ